MGKTLVLTYIENQIKKGYSPIVLFVGRQRTGKTACAMRFAWELDHKWTPELMTYKIEDFVNLYDKYNNKIIILDEASVPLDPYEHANITQRVYKHVIDTQAYKQNIVFLVLPFARGIGKQHRDHVNVIVNMRGRGYYQAKAVLSRHDDLSFRVPWTMIIEEVWGIPLPPKEIWEQYKLGGQAVYKQNIMEMQKQMLQRKLQKTEPKKITSIPFLIQEKKKVRLPQIPVSQ